MKSIAVRLDNNSALRHSPEVYAAFCRNLLECVVGANRETLKLYPNIPPLYESGVRYQQEPLGCEWFDDILIVLTRGWGDCDDLVAWRVAELREQGEPAEISLQWAPSRLHPTRYRLFHVVVRRSNGEIEDPSHILGMPL